MNFLILILIPLAVGLWAQYKVKSVYGKYVKTPSRGGITGREAAAAVMRHAGIQDVEIVPCHELLPTTTTQPISGSPLARKISMARVLRRLEWPHTKLDMPFNTSRPTRL